MNPYQTCSRVIYRPILAYRGLTRANEARRRSPNLIFTFRRPLGQFFCARHAFGHHRIQQAERNARVFVFKAPTHLLHVQKDTFAMFAVGPRARLPREAPARAGLTCHRTINFHFRKKPPKPHVRNMFSDMGFRGFTL